ncbi:MAG: hypothetical protein PHX38_12090 [Sulfuricella sp.]|nr:hypothetical protein [Sulfuricella sp.]
MKDIYDYLRRMVMAIFLCPVSVAFWLAFGMSGFAPGRFMHFLGALSQRYAAMDAAGQGAFLSQVLFGWAVLAFVFMLISFVVLPPRFGYVLRKRDGKAVVAVVE